MTPQPRKHHYIPRFYLKKWCGADGRLERYTKYGNKIAHRRVHPNATGWKKGLYDISDAPEDSRAILETHFFQILDDKAAPAFKKLNEPSINLSDADKAAWTWFIQSLFTRTPRALNAAILGGRRVWTEMKPDLSEKYQSLRSNADPLTFQEFESNFDVLKHDNSTMRFLPELILNQNITNEIYQMRWSTMDLSQGLSLLISDNLALRSNGIRKPDGHLAMPISPSRLLIISQNEEIERSIHSSPPRQIVKAMNEWIVGGAEEFVGATDCSQDRLIRNRFGSDLKPTVHDDVGT